jgi:hypothetical protein
MRARVTRQRNRIWLWCSVPTPHLERQVPGANWSKRDKVWTLPLSMDVCRHLRSHFGEALEILPPLAEWARAEVAKENSPEAGGSRSSDHPGAVPGSRQNPQQPVLSSSCSPIHR